MRLSGSGGVAKAVFKPMEYMALEELNALIAAGESETLAIAGGPGAPLLVHPLRRQPSVGGYAPVAAEAADTEVGPPS